jgi:hypothetical protein
MRNIIRKKRITNQNLPKNLELINVAPSYYLYVVSKWMYILSFVENRLLK